GVTGAVFQMVNHAFAVGALFLMSGVIHEHMGTRTIRELSGFAKAMPKTSVLLVLSSLAAMGFPGFGNFISEYVIILAGISINLFYAIAVLVPGITAGYFVWMLRRVLMSPKEGGVGAQREAPYYTLLTLAAFLVPLLIFGLYPAPLWGIISSTVKAVPGLFQP
ncbi:MAG TPA: proton-conducting transporter membrane subunit, partial [Candidatus Bathyarchaeia archaeon]|nr:proton-conducting transporter membrane subunit [Candidatus Bathyarchaeia archaeon]